MRTDDGRSLTETFPKNLPFADVFELLFENASEAIFIIDARGKAIAINRKAEELTYTKRQDFVARHFRDLIPPETTPLATRNFLKVVKEGKPTRIEFKLKSARRGNVAVEVSSIPCVAKGKVIAVLGIIQDITERKLMEQKLRESEERFRSLADSAADAMITANEDGKIVFWNRGAEIIFGYSADEAIGKPISITCPKNLWKKNHETGNRPASAHGDPSGKVFECTGLRKNRTQFPIEVSYSAWKTGTGTFYTSIVRDITIRRQAEEALRSSEAKFRTLFENVPDGVYQSSSSGRILAANAALINMLGYSSLEELRNINIADTLYVNPKNRKIMTRKLEKEGKVVGAEILLKRRNGQTLIALENSHIVRDKHGAVICYEGTLTDITERKMLEERLSALNLYAGKLNTAQDLHQIYDLTLDALEQTLGFENAAFLLKEKEHLRVVSQRGRPHRKKEIPLSRKKGITRKAANTRKPVLVSDVRKEKDYIPETAGIMSEVAIPVVTENRVLGVLDAQSRQLGAFDKKDATLIQILASHAATAISNLEKRAEIEKRSNQLTSLMRSSAEIIRATELRQCLEKIARAIREHGWRRAVIRVTDRNLDTASPEDMVTAGLTEKERKYLWNNKQPGRVWQERFGEEYERFKIGEFYHLPWSDPWVREKFSIGTVDSKLKPEEMVDWDPQDLLYAPLRLTDGRTVGIISIDDPLDGRRPTRESLVPLELFLHQAAIALENARLIQQLNKAKSQVKKYADSLEVKVKERTRELTKRTEDLRKSEEKLRSIFSASPNAITVTDLEGNVVECNEQTLKMHGYVSKGEVIGRSSFEFIAKRDHQKATEGLKGTLEQGSIRNLEFTFVAKDGREFPAELSASAIRDSSGKPIAFVGITKDITERKLMEQQLLKSERLAAIGQVAAMVGHDLRNPLTGIAGAAYYLKMKSFSNTNQKTKEMLEIIEKDIDYSNKIVNDLLEYSKEIRLELTEASLRSIALEALSLVQVPKNILVSTAELGKQKTWLDEEKTRRVFVNIIKNAIDAMPNGGRLAIGSQRRKACLEIVFTDSGTGMSKDVLEKLWTPLFTTKARGMGFGLPICKRIIEAHGGSIFVESTIGKGTTFRVTFPLRPKTDGGENIWVDTPESLLLMTTKA